MQAIKEKNKECAKRTIKNARKLRRKNKITDKRMHGQYINILNEPHVDYKESLAWLKSSTLKRTTEATICAIQEQAITTKYIQTHIHKTTTDDKCRACLNAPETIHHIISGCPVLAPTKYLQRHDNLCKYIHIQLTKKYNIETNDPKWYEYDPEPHLENEDVKILWNFPVQTDRTVHHNKPDILIIEKKERKAFIIDIAVPNDANIMRKRLEKIRNYNDLAFEIKELWNLTEVKIIPIRIGATGIIHNNFHKEINKKLTFNINVREAQKIVLLGTVNINRYFFNTQF
jgi:hypothetical protein